MRVDARDQRQQAAGLGGIPAPQCLFHRDQQIGLQFQQGALRAAIGRLFLAGGQVVLHRIAPRRRHHAMVGQCLRGALVQGSRVILAHRFGQRIRVDRRRCRYAGLRCLLAAGTQQHGDGQHDGHLRRLLHLVYSPLKCGPQLTETG